MTDRRPAVIIAPSQVYGRGEAPDYPFDLYTHRLLAQGDSWFSIGALPPAWTTRILDKLRLLHSAVIVNCAYPGARLHRMADTTRAGDFTGLLTGRMAMKWDAILLSGGGNDLIEAVGAPPGPDPTLRLLRTPAERGTATPPPAGYVSEPGWSSFAAHLREVFHALVDLRDAGVNGKGSGGRTPIVWHNYARVMPRPAPAGPRFGPWLLPALQAYGIPPADQLAVSDELMARLRQLIDALVAERQARDPGCRVFVADSMSAGVQLAAAGSSGTSGDWVNEIHLTPDGYAKCAAAWQQVLDPLLG